jgi:hypothetical protein
VFAAWIAVKESVDNGVAGNNNEIIDLKGKFIPICLYLR